MLISLMWEACGSGMCLVLWVLISFHKAVDVAEAGGLFFILEQLMLMVSEGAVVM